MDERGKTTPSELQEWIMDKYEVRTEKAILRRAICQAKKSIFWEMSRFGTLAAFLEILSQTNEKTKTSLTAINGMFQRAFLALGMCVDAFTNTTRVTGLEACHLKSPYGGVILVMTVLDGNGQVFPGALGIAESENVETWAWFLDLMKQAFRIEDNGKGIAAKDLPNIFDRFYRTDSSRNSSKGGSGIGLSIVRKIIEDHGGRIWATSKEGIGTEVHFVLRKYQEVVQE